MFPGTQVLANYQTHPRQMLREAARLFAPWELPFVFAATGTAMYLERYFSEVATYNSAPVGLDGVHRWMVIQRLRRQIGDNLGKTNMRLATEHRWKLRDDVDYDFVSLCVMPPQLAEQITGYAGDPGKDEGDGE